MYIYLLTKHAVCLYFFVLVLGDDTVMGDADFDLAI
jgi:hypothetical protein